MLGFIGAITSSNDILYWRNIKEYSVLQFYVDFGLSCVSLVKYTRKLLEFKICVTLVTAGIG